MTSELVAVLLVGAAGGLFLWTVLCALVVQFPRALYRLRWLLADPTARARVELRAGSYSNARRLLARLRVDQVDDWNVLVNELINAGFYREALALRPTAHRWAARRSSPGLYELVCLNRAEALYNLGRWKRAERLMRALAGRGDELVVHGGLTQLAWIEVNLGNVEVAEGLMSSVDEKTFPRAYRAEPWFTRARFAIAMKDGPGALRFLDESRRRLVRPSSERNERFLRAWALSLAGDEAGALREYEAAASHPYRGQGGDGLVRWGELLFRRGERERAHAAWKLAVERDPQSESARVAQERLAADDQRRPQEEGEASV